VARRNKKAKRQRNLPPSAWIPGERGMGNFAAHRRAGFLHHVPARAGYFAQGARIAGGRFRTQLDQQSSQQHAHAPDRTRGSLDSYSTKTRMNTRLSFLRNLRDLEHAQTSVWLAQHADTLGKCATVKL